MKKSRHLKVTFDTGISEYWVLDQEPINKLRSYHLPLTGELFKPDPIPKFKQFETNKFLYPDDYEILKHHFIVKKSDIDKAGWCDIRFFVHDLAVELAQEGYIPLRYTKKILNDDLEDLKNEDLVRYQHSLIRFSAFTSLPPSGRRIIMHFMPCYAEECWDFYSLYRIINKLLDKDFSREDIVYRLSKNHQITRHPAYYRALFNQWFPVAGKKILDLSPNWGFKALAVLIEGGEYYCDSPYLNNFKKMAGYLGGYINEPNQSNYDLAIVSDVKALKINQVDKAIAKHKHLADYLLLCVGVDTVEEWKFLIGKYKPCRTLRVSTTMINQAKNDNMVMIVKS